MLGKIAKMNKPTAKLQLNVQWKAGDVAGQQAKLSDYFKLESGETPHAAGNWFYYARSPRAATTESRRRRSRGGEGEAESKGAGDDDDFGGDGDEI